MTFSEYHSKLEPAVVLCTVNTKYRHVKSGVRVSCLVNLEIGGDFSRSHLLERLDINWGDSSGQGQNPEGRIQMTYSSCLLTRRCGDW